MYGPETSWQDKVFTSPIQNRFLAEKETAGFTKYWLIK